MPSVVVALLQTVLLSWRSRAALHAEILALRHQLHVLQRSRPQRIRLTPADRALWVCSRTLSATPNSGQSIDRGALYSRV